MGEIVVHIRDCKNQACGHDRSNHLEFPVMQTPPGQPNRGPVDLVERRRPMNCQARGCNCTRFMGGDKGADSEFVQHKSDYEKDQEQKQYNPVRTTWPQDLFGGL